VRRYIPYDAVQHIRLHGTLHEPALLVTIWARTRRLPHAGNDSEEYHTFIYIKISYIYTIFMYIAQAMTVKKSIFFSVVACVIYIYIVYIYYCYIYINV